jgi:hypothetical protein
MTDETAGVQPPAASPRTCFHIVTHCAQAIPAGCDQNPEFEVEKQKYVTSRRRERHPWSSCHHCETVSHVFTKGCDSSVPQLEVLASLQSQLSLGLADGALQSQDDLLGGLGLLVEDWLGLTSVTGLLSVVTTLTLGEEGSLMLLSVSNCPPSATKFRSVPFRPCTG